MVFIFLFIMLVASLAAALYATTAVYAAIRTRVPYVPTLSADIPFLVKEFPITKNDTVYDLGSGNGRVVFAIERDSGARVAGGELILYLHLLSLVKRWWYKSQARFYFGNFHKIPLKDATIIYVYLFPRLLPHVLERVRAECLPGTKIISRDFEIDGIEPIRVISTPSEHKFLVYEV
jgi:hypothetical protein